MKPPIWHWEVMARVRQALPQMESPSTSWPVFFFLRKDGVHQEILFPDHSDPEEATDLYYQINYRFAQIRSSGAEAYAFAELGTRKGEGGSGFWALLVSGAEASDDCEQTWLLKIERPETGGAIIFEDCWEETARVSENLLGRRGRDKR